MRANIVADDRRMIRLKRELFGPHCIITHSMFHLKYGAVCAPILNVLRQSWSFFTRFADNLAMITHNWATTVTMEVDNINL